MCFCVGEVGCLLNSGCAGLGREFQPAGGSFRTRCRRRPCSSIQKRGQCALSFFPCGWMCPVLRIRDPFIPNPTFFHPGSRIRHFLSRIHIKEFKYFNPRKWFLSSRKYNPGCSSRILTFYPSRIPDPGVKKAPDPGSGSAKLDLSMICRYIDERVVGSGMGRFLVGGHWPKILPQNSKEAG
jgi:hypothetical protein